MLPVRCEKSGNSSRGFFGVKIESNGHSLSLFALLTQLHDHQGIESPLVAKVNRSFVPTAIVKEKLAPDVHINALRKDALFENGPLDSSASLIILILVLAGRIGVCGEVFCFPNGAGVRRSRGPER